MGVLEEAHSSAAAATIELVERLRKRNIKSIVWMGEDFWEELLASLNVG